MVSRRTRLVTATEALLTWRKRRILKKKEKQARKHPVVDWIEAFLWAAAVVLLINQYVFQAYEIPSSSMENTLLIKDRIFVNKMIYGPELIPTMWKLPGFKEPERREVIIFESPTYLSKGAAFDVLQRVIYMLTLSLVDIDRDENGMPRAHFLIKRAAAVEYDRLRISGGNLELKPMGTPDWVPEMELRDMNQTDYTLKRLALPAYYPAIRAAGVQDAYNQEGIPARTAVGSAADPALAYMDRYEWRHSRAEGLYRINPQERRYGGDWRRYEQGWYIPAGWIFPLGDNRDNSNDARYFGPVRLSKVLGRAMFKYWPAARIGAIR